MPKPHFSNRPFRLRKTPTQAIRTALPMDLADASLVLLAEELRHGRSYPLTNVILGLIAGKIGILLKTCC
jgi:hypothetical protein